MHSFLLNQGHNLTHYIAGTCLLILPSVATISISYERTNFLVILHVFPLEEGWLFFIDLQVKKLSIIWLLYWIYFFTPEGWLLCLKVLSVFPGTTFVQMEAFASFCKSYHLVCYSAHQKRVLLEGNVETF